jgi:pimeloyl-ACP methyl ester carboxylesterase
MIIPATFFHRRVCLVVALVSLAMLPGCAATFPSLLEAKPMTFAAVPATVFVADGAGNYQFTTTSLRTVLQKDGYPIEVVTYDWSHGSHRIFADHLGYQHAREEGKKLALAVLEYHAAHPGRPIYLLGHSAGATVAVVALENLPPGVVDRAVLLSPALSTQYDIRPALRSVKSNLYVFYSRYDCLYLGIATGILGTPDHRWTAPAGRAGFCNQPDLDDPTLLDKLVQRPWKPNDVELGNNGGHYGNYQPDFLRIRVIPLLNPTILPNR